VRQNRRFRRRIRQLVDVEPVGTQKRQRQKKTRRTKTTTTTTTTQQTDTTTPIVHYDPASCSHKSHNPYQIKGACCRFLSRFLVFSFPDVSFLLSTMASRQLSNPRALGTLTNRNQGGVLPTSITITSKPSASRSNYARQVTDVIDLLEDEEVIDLVEEEEEEQQQPHHHAQAAKFELPSDSEGEEEDQDHAAAPGHGRYMIQENTPTTMLESYESSDDELEPAAAAINPNSYLAKMVAIRDSGLPCLDPHAAAASSKSADELRPTASEDKDWMTTQIELDELFTMQLKTRMDHVPKIEMPELLAANGVKLYKYQKQGVQWLVHKETTHEALPPFYTERPMGYNRERVWYENTLTKRMQRERPEPIRGSILADGKCHDDDVCVRSSSVCMH
jgi:hypothetical protein